MKRNRQNHIAYNTWGHLKVEYTKQNIQKTLCEEHSDSGLVGK